GAGIDVALVLHMRGRESGIKGRPSGGNARVKLAIVSQQRRFDFGSILGAGLASIKRNRGGEIGSHPHRQLVHHTAAKAKPDRAEFTGTFGTRFQPDRCGQKILGQLGAVEPLEQLRAFLVIIRITANRGQPVGRESDEPGDRQPPRDVTDVGLRPRFSWMTRTTGSFAVALLGRTRYPFMLPLPRGDGTVAHSAAMRLSCSGTCTAHA